MTRTSWLKKIWKGRSKGVSTVIGTVFLMLIIFMVSTNVLLWTFSQNALYTQAEKDVNQEETDRRNENVIASDVKYSVPSEGKVKVETELTNAGSVAVQIVNLWVFDNTNQTYGFNNTIESLNLNLNPGNSRTVSVVVTVPEADQNHKFNSFFVTARGNVVPLKEKEVTEETTTWANVTQGIGSLAMNFQNFTYYNVGSAPNYLLSPYPSGYNAYYVQNARTNKIAFKVTLTNFDQNERDITLTSGSELFIIYPSSGSNYMNDRWYIVNVNEATGAILSSFSSVTLRFNQPTAVYFASSSRGTLSPAISSLSASQVPVIGAVNLALVGQIGGVPFGQNIPFVSIEVAS